jgi:hypothetical protein
MTRTYAIFLFLTSSCLAQTFVSSAGYEDLSGGPHTTVNVVFGGGVAAGNALACYINYGNSGNSSLTLAVTGTGGEAFTQAGTNAEVNATAWSGLYIRSNSAGGTPYTAKFTFSSAGYASYISIVCGQYSSVSPSSAIDQTAQGVNNGATGTYPYNFCTTGAFTTASANEIVILGVSGGPPYAATGFTLRGTSGSNSVAALLDKNVTSIQNGATATVTGAQFINWNCNLATLETSATPAVSVLLRSRTTIY